MKSLVRVTELGSNPELITEPVLGGSRLESWVWEKLPGSSQAEKWADVSHLSGRCAAACFKEDMARRTETGQEVLELSGEAIGRT